MEKNIAKKSFLYFIGNFSSRMLSVLLIPIYAYKVNSYDLGNYDNAQSWMNIIIPIIFIAIWEAILKFVLAENNDNKQKYIISSSLLFVFVITVIFLIISINYNRLYKHSENVNYIIFMVIFSALSQIWQYFARAMKKNKIYVISGIVSTFINLGLIILLLCIFNLGIKALFIAYIISQLSVIMVIELNVRILSNFSLQYLDIDILKKLLIFSFPLVLNLISGWLISGFGRIVITQNIGFEANGLYSFANKFALLVTTLGSVITMSIIEEAIIMSSSNDFDIKFTLLNEKVFKLFEALIILAIPVISIFYYIIQDTEYYLSIAYTPLLMIYAVIMTMATNFGAAFQVLEKTKYQFISTFIGAIITVMISLSFLNTLGVMSVILGQMFGVSAILLSRYYFINKFMFFKINWNPVLLNLLLFLVLSLICQSKSLLVRVIVLIIALIYEIYSNKDSIILIKLYLRKKLIKTY